MPLVCDNLTHPHPSQCRGLFRPDAQTLLSPDLEFLLPPPRYEDALGLLLTEVLNRIQFRYNQAQLEELDDETLDDDVRDTPSLICSHCHALETWKLSASALESFKPVILGFELHV